MTHLLHPAAAGSGSGGGGGGVAQQGPVEPSDILHGVAEACWCASIRGRQQRPPLRTPCNMGSASDDAAVLADLAQLKLDGVRSVQAAGVHAAACSARPLAEPPRPHCPGRRATLKEHRSCFGERWRRGSSRTSSRQPRAAVRRQRRTKPTAGKVWRLQACCCGVQDL